MSDDKKMIEVSSVPHDALVDIKVSGAFFSRLQLLYFYTSKLTFDNNEELAKAMAGLLEKEKFTESEDGLFQIQTLMMLLHTIDIEFKNKGLVTIEKVEAPNAG